MAIPLNFRYREVLLKGMPKHEKTDPFRIKHPRMDVGHRAKIFAPFDALKGFDEALEASRALHEEKIRQEKVSLAELGDIDVYTILY